MADAMNAKAWFVTHNIKQYEIAELLGISLQSVNNKLNGRQDFLLPQIKKLHDAYGIEAEIFLN